MLGRDYLAVMEMNFMFLSYSTVVSLRIVRVLLMSSAFKQRTKCDSLFLSRTC